MMLTRGSPVTSINGMESVPARYLPQPQSHKGRIAIQSHRAIGRAAQDADEIDANTMNIYGVMAVNIRILKL